MTFIQIAICEERLTYNAGRVPMTAKGLESLLGSLQPTDRVVTAVSGGAWEVARRLEGYENRVVVVSPDDTGIAQARIKTDKLDARKLAYLLWKGQLDVVWVPDERARVLGRRLARREQLVHGRSRVKNEEAWHLDAPGAGQAAALGSVRGQGQQVAAFGGAGSAGRGGRNDPGRAQADRVLG